MKEATETEAIILKAAYDIFLENGFDGTRMQQIADRAGINKALLHYYFRSKQQLFNKIFVNAIQKFIPNIISIFMKTDLNLFDKIRQFTSQYIDILLQEPFVPLFVLNELSRNHNNLIETFSEHLGEHIDFVKKSIKTELQNEYKKANIIKIDYKSLIVNMLSLCIFPFVSKPIIKNVLFDKDEKAYNKFIEKRKTEVAEFIINSIKKQ